MKRVLKWIGIGLLGLAVLAVIAAGIGYAALRNTVPSPSGMLALSGLSEPVVEDYLRHALHFELDSGDLEGLNLYYRLAAEDGLIPPARPLAFL